MANLTFADLQLEVYDHTGLDSTVTANQTRVQRWINYVQQDVCARWPWSFLLGREAIATVADYSTGTVDIANGGTAVTGHSTAWTTTQGDGTYFIQFSGTNDFYNVSARGSTTALTLQTAFQGTTLTTSAYILRKFFYSLSAAADEVLDIRNWNTPVKMIQVDFRTIDLINPLVQSTNSSYAYMMYGTDSSGNLVYSPYPFPSDTRLFEFRTRKRPTDMAADADPPSIPNKFAHVLAWGAIAIGFAYLRKFQEAQAWNVKFEQRLDQMKKEYRQSGDYQPLISSIDSIERSRWIQFPSNYPNIGS